MRELIAVIWDNVTFYGPAFASVLVVLASGLTALVVWVIIRKLKK